MKAAVGALVAAVLGSAAMPSAAQGYGMKDIGGMDCVAANAHLDKGIAAGNGEAAYTAAQMVVRRVCFKRDMAAYTTLLRKAVDGGHKPAMNDLAYATALGEGLPRDYAAAGALWRRAGNAADPALDDYSLGVAQTLLRLAHRYSRETTPLKLTVRHRFKLGIAFDPAAFDSRSLTVEPLDAGSPGSGDEASALLRNVERDLADSWKRALRRLPAFDAARIGRGNVAAQWTMVYYPSREDTPRVEAIETWLPH